MRKIVIMVFTVLFIIAGIVLGLIKGIHLTPNQLDTLKILGFICLGSALYCFIVGEITRNNSQMDKLWSILPIAYVWVIAAKGGMTTRLIIMAILVTAWGIRLTFNFARKGAYSIKFWQGEEDYRWAILREKPAFQNRILWGAFDLFFIAIYQNAIVLAICLPALAVMPSLFPLGAGDYIATVVCALFLIYETIADEQQWNFQTTKWSQINQGTKLEELPSPYNLGFNTVGLWNYSTHPNYLGEQMMWIGLYLFTISAKVNHWFLFNWSIVGCLLLVLLFLGSATLAESISSKKYPRYSEYSNKLFRYLVIPFRKYRE